MNKICTSIEQSKKLIELGIDVNTADLTVTNYPLQDGSRFDFICCKLPNDMFPSITDGKSEKIPAWSLSALLKILPLPTIEETMITTTETKWKCTIYCESYAKYWSELHNDAIDAAFEMVVWLKENKKI